MRRHVSLSCFWVRRFLLLRPRFFFHSRVRGGATFTMFLFVLLLICAGFMYFYYQKCQALDRELVRLRGGEPVTREHKVTTVSRTPLSDVASAMRDRLLATPVARRSPVPQAAVPEDEQAKAEAPVPDARSTQGAPRKVRVAEATPETDALASPKPRERNGIAQAAEETETANRSGDVPESAAPGDSQPAKTPSRVTRPASPAKSKPTAAVKVKVPKRAPATKPASTGDDFGDVLRMQGSTSTQ